MTAVCFCFADDMDDLDCQTDALQGLPNQITPMCTPANESSSVVPAIQSGQTQGFQSADSIHVRNLLTSALYTVNTMWTN